MSAAAARTGVALFIAGHYLFNHPLSYAPGPTLDGALAVPWREVLLAGVVLVGSCGLGRWLSRPAGGEDPAEQVVAGLVMGSVATTLAILALGLAGAFTRAALACVAGLLLVCCRWGAPPVLAVARQGSPLLALLLVFPLAQAMAPPIVYDVLSYHLPEPRRFLEAGVISRATTGMLGHYPFALEMLSALGMSLTSDRAPGLIGFGYYLALLVAVAALARRAGAPARGAVLVVAALPVAQRLAGSAKPDFAMAFALVAATLFALRYRDTAAPRDALLAGAAAGLAAGFKMLGGLLALPVLVLVVRHPRALVVAALIASPWYVKSALWTGNPFYPAGNAFVYRHIRNPVLKDGWFSEHPALAHLSGDALVQVWGTGLDPLLPYRVLVDSREPKPDEPASHFGGELSPLILILFAYRAPARALAILAAVQFVLVSLVAQQARFYVAPLALLAPLATARHPLALALAALVAVWGLAGTAQLAHARGDLPAALGLRSERAYLEANVECQKAFALAPPGKILLLYEQRTYPLRVPSIGADNWLPLTALELLVSARSVDELIATLRARGVTHLYVSRYGLALLTGVSGAPAYQQLLVDLMKRVERTYVDEHGYLLGLP